MFLSAALSLLLQAMRRPGPRRRVALAACEAAMWRQARREQSCPPWEVRWEVSMRVTGRTGSQPVIV